MALGMPGSLFALGCGQKMEDDEAEDGEEDEETWKFFVKGDGQLAVSGASAFAYHAFDGGGRSWYAAAVLIPSPVVSLQAGRLPTALVYLCTLPAHMWLPCKACDSSSPCLHHS